MNAAQFKSWQKKLGWTNGRTAVELCISKRQVINYRTGSWPVPAQTAKLCKLLAAAAG